MPRRAREKSESGIYHVIFRGANRQEIFHDDEDSLRFLETLGKYKEKTSIKVYAWCLMGNHVHLVLEEGEEELSTTMKRLGVSYAWYYNRKYNTVGHLFQDRYKSERIDGDEYLLTVIRYIHRNPVKAGITKRVSEWKWSSYNGYYGKEYYPTDLLDRDFILGILNEDKYTAERMFKEFNEANNEDICLEEGGRKRLTDEEAVKEMKLLIPELNIAKIKSLPKEERNKIISEIKGISGLTQRQAARIMGISPNLIFKN